MLLQNFNIKNSCNLLINEYFARKDWLFIWPIYCLFYTIEVPCFGFSDFRKQNWPISDPRSPLASQRGSELKKTVHGRHRLYSKCYFFGFSFCNTDFCNFSLVSERNNRQRYELWTAFIKEVPFCTSYFTQRCILINFCSMTFRAWNMCKIFSLVPSKKPCGKWLTGSSLWAIQGLGLQCKRTKARGKRNHKFRAL